jgi:hypothetical protein
VDRNLRVFDQAFLPGELMKDVLLNLWADRPGLILSLIGDRKLRGVPAVLFEQGKKSTSADLQDVKDILQLDLFVDVTLE